METRYLKTLIAAVEQGSFSKAAKILHITQSAVSQRIKFLEEHFDQQLLDRSGPRLVLTTAGQVVAAKAREILEKESELFDCLRDSDAVKRLSLCCTPTFGMAYLPRVLNEFFRVHSDLNDLKFIFMQPAHALRGLGNEEYDLAIIEHRLDQEFAGFKRYALPDDEMLFVLSPNSGIPGEKGEVALEELTGLRLFARRDGCSSKEILRQNLASCGCDFEQFSSVIVSDDLRFTVQSILEGNGVAYLSRAVVADYMASGQLVGLRVKGFDHRRGRSVVMPAGRIEEGLLGDLLECIFSVLSPFWRPKLSMGGEAGAALAS